jgi:hypothetical protein
MIVSREIFVTDVIPPEQMPLPPTALWPVRLGLTIATSNAGTLAGVWPDNQQGVERARATGKVLFI